MSESAVSTQSYRSIDVYLSPSALSQAILAVNTLLVDFISSFLSKAIPSVDSPFDRLHHAFQLSQLRLSPNLCLRCTFTSLPRSSSNPIYNLARSQNGYPGGVRNSPLNMFHSIRQLQKIVTSCSNELQAGSINQQYLVFLHVTNDQLANLPR